MLKSDELVDDLLWCLEGYLLDYLVASRASLQAPSWKDRGIQAKKVAKATRQLLTELSKFDDHEQRLYAEQLYHRLNAYRVIKARNSGDSSWLEHAVGDGLNVGWLMRELRGLASVAEAVSEVKLPSGRKLDPSLAVFALRVWELFTQAGLKDSVAKESKMDQAFAVVLRVGGIERDSTELLKSLRSWKKTAAARGELSMAFAFSKNRQRPLP